MNTDIRWKQRFENFEKALRLLREALVESDQHSILEIEGTVQRFEFTFELAWKTLKDYLEETGIPLSPGTPKNVIKEAFSVNIIQDGQLWIDMMETRNQMSHTYDEAAFGTAVKEISKRYIRGLEELYDFLLRQLQS